MWMLGVEMGDNERNEMLRCVARRSKRVKTNQLVLDERGIF